MSVSTPPFPIEVTDMGTTYEYVECTVEIGYHGTTFDQMYGRWDPGVEYARLEIEGIVEDLPWVHASTVDVRAPWETTTDGEEASAHLEFSAEPHTVGQRFSSDGERMIEVAVEATDFEIISAE